MTEQVGKVRRMATACREWGHVWDSVGQQWLRWIAPVRLEGPDSTKVFVPFALAPVLLLKPMRRCMVHMALRPCFFLAILREAWRCCLILLHSVLHILHPTAQEGP